MPSEINPTSAPYSDVFLDVLADLRALYEMSQDANHDERILRLIEKVVAVGTMPVMHYTGDFHRAL